MDELIEEIMNSLEAEEIYMEPGYSVEKLRAKVKNAINEVIRTRRYPTDWSDEDKLEDLGQFISNIRNIALYDYNQLGAEFQSYSGEGAIFRNFTDRNKQFYGVTPFAVFS